MSRFYRDLRFEIIVATLCRCDRLCASRILRVRYSKSISSTSLILSTVYASSQNINHRIYASWPGSRTPASSPMKLSPRMREGHVHYYGAAQYSVIRRQCFSTCGTVNIYRRACIGASIVNDLNALESFSAKDVRVCHLEQIV